MINYHVDGNCHGYRAWVTCDGHTIATARFNTADHASIVDCYASAKNWLRQLGSPE